MYREAFGLSVS